MNRSTSNNLEKLGSLVGLPPSKFVQDGDCYSYSILRFLENFPNLEASSTINKCLVHQWVEQVTIWCRECSEESEVLNRLNKHLASRTYLVGNDKSVADLIVFVFIKDYFKHVAASDKHNKWCHVYRWTKFISSQY